MTSILPLSSSSALQIIVVHTPGWNSSLGMLHRFERTSPQAEWCHVAEHPIVIGKNGMRWGLGLHPLEEKDLPLKIEGDLATPAGIFSLGAAFGDKNHASFARHLPYLLINEDLECVDDPLSSYYNQFVYKNTIPSPDWNSSEKMIDWLPFYQIGIMVHHNAFPAKPHAGSCVFLHIWHDASSGTAGCTAMEESRLQELISWLDMEKNPLLIQLPREEYAKKQQKWKLPALPS